jgi:hypothetical protein
MIRFIERHASAVVCHPLYAHLLEKSFIQFLYIGLPTHPARDLPVSRLTGNQSVRILHAPSNPKLKGTPKIREAVKNLKARGYALEFIEIVGKSNKQVLLELANCDFVVDQLYSDTPMATFTKEAALFGKPSIVCGYAKAELERLYPPDIIPPSHYCLPDQIEKAIETMLRSPEYCSSLGEKARAFVLERWSSIQVAERINQIIQEDIPPDWFYDPKDIRYLSGAGAPENVIREAVSAIIDQYGKHSLCLSDKSELEDRLVEFAFSDPL